MYLPTKGYCNTVTLAKRLERPSTGPDVGGPSPGRLKRPDHQARRIGVKATLHPGDLVWEHVVRLRGNVEHQIAPFASKSLSRRMKGVEERIKAIPRRWVKRCGGPGEQGRGGQGRAVGIAEESLAPMLHEQHQPAPELRLGVAKQPDMYRVRKARTKPGNAPIGLLKLHHCTPPIISGKGDKCPKKLLLRRLIICRTHRV